MIKHLQRLKEENPTLKNAGKPWSPGEQDILLQRIKDGKSVIEIGEEFGRTSGGISARLRVIAFQMYQTNNSIDTISQVTGLSISEVEKTISRRNSETIKKVKDTEDKILKKEPVKATLITIPQSDILELKLVMFEIRDLLHKIANQK